MTRVKRWRVAALFLMAAALLAAYDHTSTEAMMAGAARSFLDSLGAEQKYRAVYDMDHQDRTTWHFLPDWAFEDALEKSRIGINYHGLTPEQRRLAEALLAAGLSRRGMQKTLSVMSLEEILRVLENDTAGRRDVDVYYYTIFGDPSPAGTWGWRVEGHHLSLNYTIKDGKLVSTSPMFFGANPHEVKQGPRKGLRVLAGEEDLARDLVRSLSEEQKKLAVVAEEAYPDILTEAQTRAELEGQPAGLPASKMNKDQVKMLMALLEEYASSMPPETASQRMKEASQTPRDQLLFAWAGSIEPGHGDYYRVQAPTFLVEYDNTQNQNNHSHTVWRDWEGDFGRDMLAEHHRRFDHGIPTWGPDSSSHLAD